MPKNIYHPENPNKTHNRLKRDISDNGPIPLLEIQRALDYLSKYGDPITLDADTIFAELQSNVTHNRQKRFLGSLIRGITRLFKGGNIFGKLYLESRKLVDSSLKASKASFTEGKTQLYSMLLGQWPPDLKDSLWENCTSLHDLKVSTLANLLYPQL